MGWEGAYMTFPSGGGCCKSVVWSVRLALGESVHSSCVCLKFVMPNTFNVCGPLANESIPVTHVLGWGGVMSGGCFSLEFSA